MQSNSLFTIKQVRTLDLLDGSTENPPEIPHKSRRKLMSPQECEISWGSQIKSRLSPITLHWLQNNSLFPIIHDKWLDFLGNYRNSLRHTSSLYRNTNFSTGTRAKLHAPHIVSRRELIPMILLNSKTNFKQAPQEEPSLSNRYVRVTLSFLPQVEWIPRFPD